MPESCGGVLLLSSFVAGSELLLDEEVEKARDRVFDSKRDCGNVVEERIRLVGRLSGRRGMFNTGACGDRAGNKVQSHRG